MPHKSLACVLMLAMLISGLWFAAGTRAGDEAAVVLPKAESLPTLEVTIKSLSGGNFSSYSMPSVGMAGTLDFQLLGSVPDNSEMIKFLKPADDPDDMGYWYIPVPGTMRVDAVSDKFGRQQVRLIGEGLGGGRLRIELDYFEDHPGTVRVWLIHEHKGFVDSVAYGEALMEGPILATE